jgi:hypothetical protein
MSRGLDLAELPTIPSLIRVSITDNEQKKTNQFILCVWHTRMHAASKSQDGVVARLVNVDLVV